MSDLGVELVMQYFSHRLGLGGGVGSNRAWVVKWEILNGRNLIACTGTALLAGLLHV